MIIGNIHKGNLYSSMDIIRMEDKGYSWCTCGSEIINQDVILLYNKVNIVVFILKEINKINGNSYNTYNYMCIYKEKRGKNESKINKKR